MSFSQAQHESADRNYEPSPPKSLSGLTASFIIDSHEPQLPADLLYPSQEIGFPGQTAADAATVASETTTTAQPTALAEHTLVSPQPRHQDVIMERNEHLEDEIWASMFGGHLTQRDPTSQEPHPVPSTLEEPGPAEISSPSSDMPQSHLTERHQYEQQLIFLPPGQGRTPQQSAAAKRLNAAVTA